MSKFFTLLLLLFVCFDLAAQGPPITTGTPVMLGLEGNGIRTFGKYISKEKADIYVQPFGIPYNVSTKFQIGAILPFKFIKPKSGSSNAGLADVAIFSKYQLYKKDGTAKTFRILATLKQSFPNGNRSEAPPIGSGTYQTYVGLIIGKISSAVGLYADFGYNRVNGAANDNFLYNLSVGVPLLPVRYPQRQINLFAEINGHYLFEPQLNNIFLTPGLQFIPGRRVLFETALQIPVLQNKNIENKTNFAIILGTRFLIR